MTERSVYARARRAASSVASVPEEVKRTFSAEGMSCTTRRAQSASNAWLPPRWVPLPTCSATAAVTAGWACPSSRDPWPMT